jgi:hypothetical protein
VLALVQIDLSYPDVAISVPAQAFTVTPVTSPRRKVARVLEADIPSAIGTAKHRLLVEAPRQSAANTGCIIQSGRCSKTTKWERLRENGPISKPLSGSTQTVERRRKRRGAFKSTFPIGRARTRWVTERIASTQAKADFLAVSQPNEENGSQQPGTKLILIHLIIKPP